MSLVGTISRGIKAPIFRKGDDLIKMVPDCVINAANKSNFEIRNNDVIGITEAIVARAQGNYATVEQISKDVSNKFGDKEVGLIFPILSRNRFALLLKGIAMGVKKLYIVLTYPQDEVGNPLISPNLIDEKGVNPFSDTFTELAFRAKFGKIEHPFTGIDYIKLYKEIAGENCEIILSNRIETILDYTPYVINADIHTRKRTKRILLEKGAKIAIGLEDILNESVDGSGYNEKYGLLGSNLATENSVKLFPRGGDEIVNGIKEQMLIRTGKKVEVLIYGDGAFKDPVGGIWELADPVVAPSYTSGLEGRPSEVKLKYIADNMLTKDCAEDELKKIIKENKAHHDDNLALGTTPRRLTDLLGSLCDLTSGSGDKGTPIVLVQGYFDDYSTE